MLEETASAKPAPMEGNGGYNRSSQVQAAGLSPAVSMLESAARTVALPAGSQPIVIADYGSSQGRNSLLPLGAAVAILRVRIGSARAISVVHTDLPENDFSVLFQTLNTDPNSYLQHDRAVFASAVGRSFYEQVLPSESVTLGWSSWAVQWLSRVPSTIPDQIQVAFSHDAPARDAFSRQAAEDWRQFLTHRERELCPGGKLTVITMAVDENGDFGYRPLLNALYSALLYMVDVGFLEREEIRRMVVPTYGRSRVPTLRPLSDRNANLAVFGWRKWTSFLARITSGQISNATGTPRHSPLVGSPFRGLPFFPPSPPAYKVAGRTREPLNFPSDLKLRPLRAWPSTLNVCGYRSPRY